MAAITLSLLTQLKAFMRILFYCKYAYNNYCTYIITYDYFYITTLVSILLIIVYTNVILHSNCITHNIHTRRALGAELYILITYT